MKRNRKRNRRNGSSGRIRTKQLFVMIFSICYFFVSILPAEAYTNDTYAEVFYETENETENETDNETDNESEIELEIETEIESKIETKDEVNSESENESKVEPKDVLSSDELIFESEEVSEEVSEEQLFNEVINTMLVSQEESIFAEIQPEMIPAEEEDMVLTEGEPDYEGAKAAITAALNNCEEIVELGDYHITVEEAWNLTDQIISETPNFRFVKKGVTATYNSSGYCTKLQLEHSLTKEEDQKYKDSLYAIYNEVCEASMSDLEKAMMLHDWIVYETQYQYGYREPYELIFEQHAVCQAYTEVYCVLLDIAGIKNAACGSSSMNHIWNNVSIDDKWYQVDCTWDDPTSHADEGVDRFGYVGHSHFLRSDNAFNKMEYHDYSNEDGITCTSDTYDDAWWINIGSRIYTINGEKYYLLDETIDDVRTHSLVKRNGDEVTRLLDVSDKWYVWGETSFYRNCAALGYDGTYLYYNNPTEVYRIKPGETTPEIFYTYTEGNGWIYGMYVSDSYMKLQISKTYDVYGGDLIELPLKGDVAVNQITGAGESTYDKDSALTLSVNSIVAEGKEASYQWYVSANGSEYTITNAVSKTYTVDWNAIKELGITHGSIEFRCVAKAGESSDEASVLVNCDLRTLFTVKSKVVSGNGTITVKDGTPVVNEEYAAFDSAKTENTIALKEGTGITYVFTPDSDYQIQDVTLDEVSLGKITEYKVSAIDANHGIKVTFEKKAEVNPGDEPEEEDKLYSVKSKVVSGNGTIKVKDGTPIINEEYKAFDSAKSENTIALKEGTGITYVFTPDSGYQIKDVILDGKSLGKITEYKISAIAANHEIQVTFEKQAEENPGEDDKEDSEDNDADKDIYHYVVVKQKFDVSKFYEGVKVSKYVITSLDTGKASITKKGMLTGKKAGKLMVTPCQKIGRKYVPIEGLEPVYMEIIAPYFIPEKMYSTYLGEKISVGELVTGHEGKQNMKMLYYITKKPVVEYVEGIGTCAVGYGSIKYKAVFTNEQGYETNIIKALKVVKLKLSVKPEMILKSGKSKSISIRNVPKCRDITWVSSDESVVACTQDTKRAYKSKVTALQPGTATISAIVDGQYYSTIITVPEM